MRKQQINEKVKEEIVIDSLQFDVYDGNWRICFHENGKSYTELYTYDSLCINEAKEISKVFAKDKQYIKKIDIGLCRILDLFDRNHKTNYVSKYLSDEMNCKTKYKLSKLLVAGKYKLKEKINILKNSYFQKKYRKAEVEYPKNTAVASLLVSGAIILGLMGINTSKEVNESKYSKFKKQVTIENEVVDDNLSIINNQMDISIDEKEVKENVYDDNSIEDKYELDSMELVDSTINPVLKANTNDLNCDYYSISLVGVVSNNEILEVEDASGFGDKSIDSIVEDYKEKYGQDINVYVNFDGYNNEETTYKNIGWTSVSNIDLQKDKLVDMTKSKVVQKVKTL